MTQPQLGATAPESKSTFVTVLAWVFIIGSAFSTLMSLLQTFIVRSFQGQFQTAFKDTTFSAHTPAGAKFLFGHFELFIVFLFALSVVTLVASIGMLRRRNWARLVFIGVLGFGVLYSVAGLFFQRSMMSGMQLPAAHDAQAQAFQAQWQSTLDAFRVFMVILTLAIAGLLAWIIARLCSRRIREEFRPSAGAA